MINQFAVRFRRLPRAKDCLEALICLIALGIVGGGLMFWRGPESLLSAKSLPLSIWAFVLVTLIVPSFLEEGVFRGLFQPGAVSSLRSALASVASLSAFVVWHPIQVWFGLPMAQAVFLRPEFLTMTALLGLCATICVHRSNSLWPAVGLHWIVVLVWKAMSAV